MTAASSLYVRKWRVTIGSVDVSDLDLSFSITRDTTREPNEARLVIFNLLDRGSIKKDDAVVVRLGYEGTRLHGAFVGTVRQISHAIDGEDVATTIVAQDVGSSYLDGEMFRCYTDASNLSIVNDCVASLGVSIGNAQDLPAVVVPRFVIAGRTRDALRDVLRVTGHRYSIQDGALQIQRGRTAINQTDAVVISVATGMIDSPAVTEGKHARDRKVEVNVAIQPGCEPGRLVKIESALVDTFVEVARQTIEGATYSDQWSMLLECKPIST